MNHVYSNMEEYNPGKTQIALIVFDDSIGTMISYKKPDPIGTKLFTRGEKLSIYFVFMIQSQY